jgi:hypothetical protein
MTTVATYIMQRMALLIVAAFALSFATLEASASAGTIFVDGSAAFASISEATGNCASATSPDCSLNPCHCVTGDAALKQQNLNKIEAGSYTIHLELLGLETVVSEGLCTSGTNPGSQCLTANDCGQTCSFKSSGTCVSCGPFCGRCSNDKTVSCSNEVTCDLTFCSASGALCSSDADCGGTPVCTISISTSSKGSIGYAEIRNATTGHELVFTFSGAGSKQSILDPATKLKSVSAAAGLATATGPFRSFAGELDFSIVQGGPLAKGGASTPPAMELSISGGLHHP